MAADEPPRPDAGSESDSNDQPTIVVDDPEDFAKTRQLRAIFDARDDYVQARRDANRLIEDKEIDFSTKNKRIFRHMQDFAMAMEPLLRSRDEGLEIWDERTYTVEGTFVKKSELSSFEEAFRALKRTVAETPVPPAKLKQLLEKYEEKRNRGTGLGTGTDTKEAKKEIRVWATDWGYEVDGLSSLVESTPELAYPVSFGKNQFQTTAPPQTLSDAAYRDLQDFIRQIGLGVQFDETQQTKIDDETLREVDQWRQENIN